ncbi:CtsR family transcriptional regulator [Halobacillus yeomjeoni]|uniref:Transcriptional regulator CtsR n=1 Tax=Halobacillus yeomjeoni TaxID=311194 RepID=A0A931HYM3_9BACI|nr:CtsR family transcriptional regulator [Halobacillus yeomjeoni]MBH0231741.1 CtsR family transcriptional regulator [Halobacillus yeomjeoni]MCA0985536.1 CtsR family transcriptional regulator [Halobacillus yeomjeoni]
MQNISDIIEQYLKKILDENKHNTIEIKRSEIADQFQCVPSQINYVIKTRFTVEKGYIVESKRGGGGYIRISKVQHQKDSEMFEEIMEMTQPEVSQNAATDVLERLLNEDVITEREMRIMSRIIDREVLAFPLPLRDEVRSRIMTAMLFTLKYKS